MNTYIQKILNELKPESQKMKLLSIVLSIAAAAWILAGDGPLFSRLDVLIIGIGSGLAAKEHFRKKKEASKSE